MSRNIDLNAPLSGEDRAFLLERGRERSVGLNEARFGRRSNGVAPTTPPPPEGEPSGSGSVPTEPEQPEGVSQEEIDWVRSLPVEQLREELTKEGQSTSGKKVELQARLLDVLAAQN